MTVRRLADGAMLGAGLIAGVGLLAFLTAVGWALNTYRPERKPPGRP